MSCEYLVVIASLRIRRETKLSCGMCFGWTLSVIERSGCWRQIIMLVFRQAVMFRSLIRIEFIKSTILWLTTIITLPVLTFLTLTLSTTSIATLLLFRCALIRRRGTGGGGRGCRRRRWGWRVVFLLAPFGLRLFGLALLVLTLLLVFAISSLNNSNHNQIRKEI